MSGIGFGGSDETRRISPQPKALAPAEALGEPGQEGDGVVHLDEPGHVEDAELRLALAPPRDNREGVQQLQPLRRWSLRETRRGSMRLMPTI